MTIIEQRTMEIICHYLPVIAKSLERIADSLEARNSKAKPSKICIDGKMWNVAYKTPLTKGEEDNG